MLRIYSRLFTCMLAMSILAACASGPRFGEVRASLQDVPPGKARVVLFRQSRFVGIMVSKDIKIDSKTIGALSDGSFLIADHEPGEIEVTVVNDFLSKDFQFAFKVEGGKTYYVELDQSGTMELPLGGGGFVPLTVGADVSRFCGPGWCAGLEDEAEALPKLSSLTRGSPP